MRFRLEPRTRLSGHHLFITTPLLFAVSLFALRADAAQVKGAVYDPSGRPLPRAYVRAIGETTSDAGGTFTNEWGEFELDAPSPCRLEATLTGFEAASVPCADGMLRIQLSIAPIRENVLVTATRTPIPASQAGASVTIFTSEDIERRQKPLLADLLVGMPGAMLMRSGGPGTLTSLYVRGGESDYNKVLLDGVPLNEPGGSFYLNNLSTEHLDRVEVVRGANSALFGSDAMSSVVQLFTKRPDGSAQPPETSAQIDGGTYASMHASAGVTGATRRFDYSVGAARLDTDNRVSNSALENATLSGNVGIALSPSATLRFVARTERERVGTPGPTAFGASDRDAFFKRHDGIVSASLDQQVTPALRQRTTYSLATSGQQSTNLIADAPYTASYLGRTGLFQSSDFTADTALDLRRHHASYQADLSVAGPHLLTLLADWDGERATARDRKEGTSNPNARDNFGVSAQQQLVWRRVNATFGARIEHNETFGTALAPRVAATFVVHAPSQRLGETSVHASAGTGVKEPTLVESFSISPYFRGNPDLDPERARTAEVGVHQRFFRDRARIGATFFHNRIRDVIQLVTTNPETFEGQYFNTGGTRARGIEFGAEFAPVTAIRGQASYTWLDGRVVESAVPDDTVFRLGAELFRRPRHSGAVAIAFDWRRLTADVHGAFVGRFVDNDFGLFSPPVTESPGHTLWDTSAAIRITRQLTALVIVENLTNTDYSEPLGYQPLLRTVRAGLKVRF